LDLHFLGGAARATTFMTTLQTLLMLTGASVAQCDMACLLAGGLVSRGSVGYAPAVVACFCGILLGDALMILIGRVLGRGITRAPLVRRVLTEERFDLYCRWVTSQGAAAVFLARFLPGIRTPAQMVVGALHANPLQTSLYVAAGAALHAAVAVGAAALLGDSIDRGVRLPGLVEQAIVLVVGLSVMALCRRFLSRAVHAPEGGGASHDQAAP
jgi:membrane protein DedA with SNARE-associated domain